MHQVRIATTFLGLCLWAGAGTAQILGDNEVWIGQVGNENQLVVEQEGRVNRAGGDSVWLMLGQEGSENRLQLRQTGYRNTFATWFAAEDDRYAKGAWQRGNGNRINIEQVSEDPVEGYNAIGSVQQSGPLVAGNAPHNLLTVMQRAAAGGAGQHIVGRVVQDAREGVNEAQIEQLGGGAGEGNTLANLRQIGGFNRALVVQDGAANQIGLDVRRDSLPIDGIVQEGGGHRLHVLQEGRSNLINGLRQTGAHHLLDADLRGEGNTLFWVDQDNRERAGQLGAPSIGNVARVSIEGNGNGAEMLGSRVPTLAAASELRQFGDANQLQLTIIGADDTRFAMAQDGDSNGGEIIVQGSTQMQVRGNDTALYQLGDYNAAKIELYGSDNAASTSQSGDHGQVTLLARGDANYLRASQQGDHNRATVTITGNGNGLWSPLASGLAPQSRFQDFTGRHGLFAGHIRQTASAESAFGGNAVQLSVLGDANGFAIDQLGERHIVAAFITGQSNSLAIRQSGAANEVEMHQTGDFNFVSIEQD